MFLALPAFAEFDTSEITYPPSNSTRIAEPHTNENTDATDSIDDSLFPQKKKVDTIWEEYNEKFLYFLLPVALLSSFPPQIVALPFLKL